VDKSLFLPSFRTMAQPHRYIVLVILILASVLLRAQDKRVYITQRLAGLPPEIDGHINEPIWDQVAWSGDFTQKEPYEFEKPSQNTLFKVLYDNDNLYVAIKVFYDNVNLIEKRLGRRDSFEGDWVGIAFDSYNDDMTGFMFGVSAAGVKNDLIVTNDVNSDDTWDPVWYVHVGSIDSGWVAEMKIPFSQLRFSNTQTNLVWGLEVMRQIFHNDEFLVWQMVPNESSSWVGMWGVMEGISNIKPKKEVELVPYVMGGLTKNDKVEGDPFQTGTRWDYNAGLDGKVAVTNDLTLNFTINPDFGQVEADPSEVNLSAFESYFQEKRPFFIEGSNIFNFSVSNGHGPTGADNLFYSRRIGRRPHLWPDIPDDQYMRLPEFTRILGAFKLSGKTRNGWSIGVMESVTNIEHALIDSAGIRRKEAVEPLTNYFNARIQKDINKGMTTIGGMVTATNRFINDTSLNFLPDAAYTGGIDFAQYWNEKDYYFRAKALASNVQGSRESILDLQTNPQRYYQRPDVGHHRLDSALTMMSGWGANVEGGKIGGGHWRFGERVTMLSPGVEFNDQGFLRRADFITQASWLGYEIWEPFSIFRTMSYGIEEWAGWDFSGRFLYWGLSANANTRFKNYWRVGTGVSYGGFDVDRPALRGGPALMAPGNWSFWLAVDSDDRKKLVFEPNASAGFSEQDYGGWYDVGLEINYQINNALQVSLEPGYNYNDRYMMYVETIEANGHTNYLVASMARNIASADLRVDYSITPNLTIQYWGQPFVFSGDYSHYKKVVDAGNFDVKKQFHEFTSDEIEYDPETDMYSILDATGAVDYTFENPDFSFFEFRSNFVIRWEYIPGSTAYVVWSQGRTGDTPDGDFTLTDHLDNLIQVNPTNIFLIKLSYRLSM